MDFSCPTCKLALKAQKLEELRLWDCASCSGFAVSLPVVRKGMAPEAFKTIWRKLASGEVGSGRPCPGCKKPLSVIETYGNSGSITIDLCRTCQVLWFDDQEFSELPKIDRSRQLGKEMSTEASRALSRLKADLVKDRSFWVKLMDNDESEENELDNLLNHFFDR